VCLRPDQLWLWKQKNSKTIESKKTVPVGSPRTLGVDIKNNECITTVCLVLSYSRRRSSTWSIPYCSVRVGCVVRGWSMTPIPSHAKRLRHVFIVSRAPVRVRTLNRKCVGDVGGPNIYTADGPRRLYKSRARVAVGPICTRPANT